MKAYVIVDFGCNSGHNDMFPPSVKIIKNYEEAYELYNIQKNAIIIKKEHYFIDYEIYELEDGECIIQDGGEEGSKRPIGVMIKKVTIH